MRSGKVRRKSVRIKTLRQRTSKKRKKRVYRKTKTRTRKIKRKRRTKKKMRGGAEAAGAPGGKVIAAQPEGHPTTFYEGASGPPTEGTHRLHDMPPGSEMELLGEREEWVSVRWRPPLDGWAKKRNVNIPEPQPEPEPPAGGAADAHESLQERINSAKLEGRYMSHTPGAAERLRNRLQALNEQLITRMKATIKTRDFLLAEKEQWDHVVAQNKLFPGDGPAPDPGWILIEWEPGVIRELSREEKTLLVKWAEYVSVECPEGCIKSYVAEGLVVDENLPVGIKIQGKIYKLVLTYV